jgi:hypothetical protein
MSAPATYALNQFAPSYKQGLQPVDQDQTGYEDKAYDYIYNPPGGQLTANQQLQDAVEIDTDADFYIAAWYLSRVNGIFQIQLTDAAGYQLSKGSVIASAVSFTASNPTVLSPAHPIPAGGKIQILIQDLSDANNPLQIVFKGWKRFRRPMRQAA